MLPKILCLHGGGSTSEIFQIQLIRLSRILAPHFEFVYLNAPLERSAGPGVLPFFEGFGPYRRWVDEDDTCTEQIDALRQLLLDTIRDKGPFVGVLGFSQGAKTAAALLLLREEWPDKIGLRFGVFFGGTSPPYDLLLSQRPAATERPLLSRVPTVHAWGNEDPWREKSEVLVNYFEPSSRRVVSFDGGHHLPLQPDINKNLADLIHGVAGFHPSLT